MDKKELKVVALKSGTVIDHIPSDKLFKVVSILALDKATDQITIGNNLESKRMGTKGIIKVSGRRLEPQELDKIALLAPNAKINIIDDYEVKEKMSVKSPEEVTDIVVCDNPQCITNHQPVATRFRIRAERHVVECHYCGRIIKENEIKFK